MKNSEWVAILDFGSQYTQLIARRIRELKVYSEILPYNTPLKRMLADKPQAIILSGGPASVVRGRCPTISGKIFDCGIPILGICYGMQLMTKVLGGKVEPAKSGEYGRADLIVDRSDDLLKLSRRRLKVWMSHGDRVIKLPAGFERIAHTPGCSQAAIRNRQKKLWGVQFHPEVIHTEEGSRILENFFKKIAGCKGNWTMRSFINDSAREIKKRVGKERVICALSGGVDSTVLAVLLQKAIGRQLTCVFVNTGLLRKGEVSEVVQRFRKGYHIKLVAIDAADSFLKKLKGITHPEEKRRIIGREFIRVFENQVKKIGKARFLAQGTLYPDVIESKSPFKGPSAVIKTHHNVGGLPKRMKFELIEPFRFLFKDEVRLVGRELRLSPEVIHRQPFPGPGLAVRILGGVTLRRLDILREADVRIQEEIRRSGLYEKIWQAFAVLLPIRTVGIMGDERTYENVVAIRAVNSVDGMTADWVKLPHALIDRISRRIINEVKGINRVVYDVSSKPPSTIEWE